MKSVLKEALGHLKEDRKEALVGIQRDKKLAKDLKKGIPSKKKKK